MIDEQQLARLQQAFSNTKIEAVKTVEKIPLNDGTNYQVSKWEISEQGLITRAFIEQVIKKEIDGCRIVRILAPNEASTLEWRIDRVNVVLKEGEKNTLVVEKLSIG